MRLPGLRRLPLREVGRRVIAEASEDGLTDRAAALAYSFLFSLFPLLLCLVALLGYLPAPNLFDRIMETLGRVLPGEALSLLQDNVRTVATEQRGGLLWLGGVLAIWGASGGFRSIMSALNRAYDVEEGRPWWKYYGFSIVATVGLAVFAVAAFALLIFGPQIGHAIAAAVGLGGTFDTVWNVLRWPAAIALLTLVVAVVYYVAPDVEQEWKWVTPGSAIAVVGWLVLSAAFSYYVQNFGSYDKTYGSVGAVIVLLVWLYLTGFMLLVGGEIDAVVEHLAPSGKRPGAKSLEDRASGKPDRAPRAGENAGRRAAADRRGTDRRALSLVPPPADRAQAGDESPPDERRKEDRRHGERRQGGHLTLVRPPEPEAPPEGGAELREAGPQPSPLLRGLVHEARHLLALQQRLAVAELHASVRRLAVGAGIAAGGAILAAVGFLYIGAAAVALLSGALSLWLAALAVAGVALLAGAATVRLGVAAARARLLGRARATGHGVPERADSPG